MPPTPRPSDTGSTHDVDARADEGRHAPPTGVGRAWTALLAGASVLTLLVVAPLFGAALTGDKRWNIYRFGGDYLREPSGIVTRQLDSIDFYLGLGNFRPLGRMFERLQDVATFLVMDLFTVPGHVAMRVANSLSLCFLAVAVVVTVEHLGRPGRLRDHGPRPLGAVAALWFAASMVASGATSSVVRFTDLYAASFAFVLLLAVAASTTDALQRRRPGIVECLLALAVGAAAAAFNEVAYLLAPLATIAVFARGRATLGLPIREVVTSAAAARLAATWVGFLAVFIPVRLEIARRCAVGGCYEGSDLVLSSDTVPLFAHRLATSLPPFGWRMASEGLEAPPSMSDRPWLLLAAALLVVVAAALLWASRSATMPAVGGQVAIALVGIGAALGGASLGATTRAMHDRWLQGFVVGFGWRDSVPVAAGMAILVAGLVGLAVHRLASRPRRLALGVVAAVVTALALGTLQANEAWYVRDLADEESQLHRAMADALLHLEDTEDHRELRCSLTSAFVELRPVQTMHHSHLYNSLNSAAETMHGTTFCERPDP